MSGVACPNCSSKTSKAAGKPYCRSCGWNISAAEESFRLNIWAYIGIAALLGVMFKDGILGGRRLVVTSGLIVLGGIVYGIRALLLRRFRTLRERLGSAPYRRDWLNIEWRSKVRDSGANLVGEQPIPPESHFAFNFEVNRTEDPSLIETPQVLEPAPAQMKIEMEKFRRLAAISLPRPVRITERGLAYLLLSVPVIFAVFYFWGYKAWLRLVFNGSSGGNPAWWLLIDAMVLTAVWVRFLRRMKRERRLLAAGELALGRVLTQGADSRSGSSKITYGFTDAQARTVTASGNDYSKQYYEGMGTIVFYDRVDSVRNVAEPCALFKIDTRTLAHKPDELGPQ